MIKEIMMFVLFIVLLIWTIILAAIISSPAKVYDNPSCKETVCNSFEYAKEVFGDRNLFGIVLSSIIVFVSIPGFIFALVFSLIFDFYGLLVFIWKLGNKKED